MIQQQDVSCSPICGCIRRQCLGSTTGKCRHTPNPSIKHTCEAQDGGLSLMGRTPPDAGAGNIWASYRSLRAHHCPLRGLRLWFPAANFRGSVSWTAHSVHDLQTVHQRHLCLHARPLWPFLILPHTRYPLFLPLFYGMGEKKLHSQHMLLWHGLSPTILPDVSMQWYTAAPRKRQ